MRKKLVFQYNGDYVDIEHISINPKETDSNYRYSLFIPFKNPENSKHVVVIMRNPSEANKNKSDKTINNVLSFCHDKYSAVYICNLYPYYETDSTKVKDFLISDEYKKRMKANSEVIDSMIGNIEDVIVAWGTNNTGHKYDKDYEDTVWSMLDKLAKTKKNIYAMRFVSSKNPWHPRNWEKNFNLELYPWSNKKDNVIQN